MKRIFLLIAVFASFNASSQERNDSILNRKIKYNYSYFANSFKNPGLNFGIEYVLKQKVRIRNKKRGNKEIFKIKTTQLNLSGNLGFYIHPKNHVGIFTYYGINYRKTKSRGFQYTLGLNPLGYYRSFLPETYKVDIGGNVKKIIFPGNSYFAPNLIIGIGRYRKIKRVKTWFVNLQTMILTPYNANFVPLFNFEFGFRF